MHQLGIIGTPREDRFDRVTRLTQALFDVPICLISVVEADTQWFKSCIGLEITGTDRSISFCAHAILAKELLLVPDATADPRFAKNPLVTGEPHIRFYAGYPLSGPSGHLVGTLCIIDRSPRTLDVNQIGLLKDLAALVESELRVTAQSELTVRATALQARYRALIDSLPAAVVLYSSQNELVAHNSQAEHLLGISRVDGVMLCSSAIIGEDGQTMPLTGPGSPAFQIAMTGNDYTDKTVSVSSVDGSSRWLSMSCRPIFGQDGLEGVVSTFFDVTARKQAEEERERRTEALRQSENDLSVAQQRLQQVLDSVGEGICGVDRQGHLSFLNNAAARMFDVEDGEHLGRHYRGILTFEPLQEGTVWNDPIGAILTGSALKDVRIALLKRPNRANLPVEISCTSKGNGAGVVVTIRDVTDRLEADRVKNEFISVVSHELRTPLTSIRGALGLLATGRLGALSDRGQRMLEIASQNTERLVRLINDILDMERIDSGKAILDIHPFEAAALIQQTVDSLQNMAEQAGVQLVVDAGPGSVMVDSDRTVQVLTNLISNALKFSEPGTSVTVSCLQRKSDFLFQVADQGRGIPPEKFALIFERFQQVDASDSRVKNGSGLGLAISRSIVEQHGGAIWVESTPGQGSTFSFTLPLVPGQLRFQNQAEKSRILVCDDDTELLLVVKELLERRGYSVETAQSSQEGLAMAIASPPAAVLLEMNMPGMTGLDVLMAMKKHPATVNTPVVIFSVLAPLEQLSAAGSSNWLTKPVSDSVLVQSLEQAMDRTPSVTQVLLVEDDHDLACVLSESLAGMGLSISHARSSLGAIEHLSLGRTNLIVLDLVLEEGDGYAVVDWLQMRADYRNIPVVVYSSLDPDLIDRGRLQSGRTEFLSKGHVSPDTLAVRIAELTMRLAKEERAPQ